jgi:hypothetical protein
MPLVSQVVLDSALRRLLGSSNRLTKKAAIQAVITLAEAVDGENVTDIMDVIATAGAIFVIRAMNALGRYDPDPLIDTVVLLLREHVNVGMGAAMEVEGHAD